MPVVLCRIDDRLIHGQVVEGWLRIINADSIVIVSDEVAKDEMQQALLSLAVPRNIKVSSFSVEEAAKKLTEGFFQKDRLLLLFSNPQDVLRFIKSGGKITSVNVGGMHYVSGKKQILRTLSVDDKDLSSLKEISSMGIELEGRVLPDDERINVIEVIEGKRKS
jgi:mannose/fructose/sorbose-specific phosphotransferase system IIB component